jgi:hypothetical protein
MNITEIKLRLEAATPGKNWINLSQSDGCEIQLFDRKYTIWLSIKREFPPSSEYEQLMKDAELLVHAPTDISNLLKAFEIMREVLEWHQKHVLHTMDLTDCPECKALQKIEELGK